MPFAHESSECVTMSVPVCCAALLFAAESILLEAHANTRTNTYSILVCVCNNFEQRMSNRLTRTLWLSAKVFLSFCFVVFSFFFFVVAV